jgi:hypothetical protein
MSNNHGRLERTLLRQFRHIQQRIAGRLGVIRGPEKSVGYGRIERFEIRKPSVNDTGQQLESIHCFIPGRIPQDWKTKTPIPRGGQIRCKCRDCVTAGNDIDVFGAGITKGATDIEELITGYDFPH